MNETVETTPLSDQSLAGKVALITGGTRGLGLGLARNLGLQGVKVGLIGREASTGEAAIAALTALGIEACSFSADVADGDAMAAAREAVVNALGPIDILLCTAGVGAPRHPIWEATAAEFCDCFDVNVLGVLNAMAAVMPAMVERGSGNVVVIGGTYGHKGAADFGLYCASKWALRGLVKSAALDAAPTGVRVNLISPGGVDGERIHRMFRESAIRRGEPEDAPLKRFLSTTALGRLVTEDDIAAALFHLVGPGGTMITGQDIVVDSGTVI